MMEGKLHGNRKLTYFYQKRNHNTTQDLDITIFTQHSAKQT